MNTRNAVSGAAFEAKYRRSSDPWQFAASPYEQHRYATILRSLPRAHYTRAFEPGCSVGVLTAALAERCDTLLACDVAPSAVRLARQRCAGFPNVRIQRAELGKWMPEGPFDLIVFSEMGYYFAGPALKEITQALANRLAASGDLVAVHWRGDSEDHVLHGDEVHAVLREALSKPCGWLKEERYREFRLDVWRRL